MKCLQCGIEFEPKRADAKYCSPRCRKIASRLESVTDNVTLKYPDVTDNFEFYTVSKANGMGREKDEKSAIRIEKYWYEIPIAAIPVIKKGWPKMPEYMNGRQYFLWWQNEFQTNDSGPVIVNPFPAYDNLRVELGGELSRRWGA